MDPAGVSALSLCRPCAPSWALGYRPPIHHSRSLDAMLVTSPPPLEFRIREASCFPSSVTRAGWSLWVVVASFHLFLIFWAFQCFRSTDSSGLSEVQEKSSDVSHVLEAPGRGLFKGRRLKCAYDTRTWAFHRGFACPHGVLAGWAVCHRACRARRGGLGCGAPSQCSQRGFLGISLPSAQGVDLSLPAPS